MIGSMSPNNPHSFSDGTHLVTYRIYYEDTDAGGIVYHANYLKFAERARTDALRSLGILQSELRATHGVFFVVRHMEIEFFASAILDDLIHVRSHVDSFGNSSMKMRQIIEREGLELAQILVQIVCVSEQRKATRIPLHIKTLLIEHMQPE